MTPAQEIHRRQAVEKALTRLADGQRYTRRALFGKNERWQDTLLAKLETMGAVEVERGKRANIYKASEVGNFQTINRLLRDEESFLTLVFPSHAHSTPDERQLGLWKTGVAAEPPPESEPESSTDDLPELPRYSGEALQRAQLQMLAGIAQLLGQFEDRLKVVEDDTTAIRKALLE